MSTDIAHATFDLMGSIHKNTSNEDLYQQSQTTKSSGSLADKSNTENPRTRSRREVVALDGHMFDTSVLRDNDDQ
ncbi:hypothetical protein BGZ76_007885, partial [Entomortierella beljakovae]